MPLVDIAASTLMRAAPSMPPDAWLATGVVIVLLGGAAIIDGFKSIIPDPIIFFGLLFVTAVRGFDGSWQDAGFYLRYAIGVGLGIWLINYLWYRRFQHDALGMGDAKWTMLAVSCFGGLSALYAWGTASVLASAFILMAKLCKRSILQIRLAPFLCIGLAAAIYWLHFRD